MWFFVIPRFSKKTLIGDLVGFLSFLILIGIGGLAMNTDQFMPAWLVSSSALLCSNGEQTKSLKTNDIVQNWMSNSP